MITLRCTKKLLSHLGKEIASEDQEPTSSLGDWYGNLFIAPEGPPLALLINERSLLSVLTPPGADVLAEFRRRAVALLRRLEISKETVEREAFHLQQIRLSKTRSRRLLGTMNEAAWQLEVLLFQSNRGPLTLEQAENRLAKTRFSMIGNRLPLNVARELLGAPPRQRSAQHSTLVHKSTKSSP